MNLTTYFPSILSFLLFSAAPVSIEAKKMRGLAELGDQRCKSDSIFEEYWNNQWIERDVSPGTKCCAHVDDPKRITLQHATFDCPTPASACTASYTPLAEDADAEMITDLSDEDDCAEEVDLGFDFKWLGGTNTISSVHVSTNGQISINPGDDNYSYDETIIGDFGAPRIALAFEDLDPGETESGKVYIKRSATSATISFENVQFYSRNGDGINVQAHLYSNGEVNICFGAGDMTVPPANPYGYDDYYYANNAFISGLEGGVNDEVYGGTGAVAAPLTGEPFMMGGISEEWPTEGSCYCFNPANGASFVSSEE